MNNALTYLGKLLKSRDFWVRVLVIIIAAIFWLLIKLQKSGYITTIEYPVLYENIPQNKLLVGEATQKISLRISSFGFRLLGYEMKRDNPLHIDVKRQTRKLKNEGDVYYWLPNLYREELETQLEAQTSLLRLEPDTVFLVLSDRVKKKLPVRFDVETTFKAGYEAYGEGFISPQEIVVSGPKVMLDSINYLETERASFDGISTNLNESLRIVEIDPMVNLAKNSVQFKLEIDQFTEKLIEVPIRLTNVPKGYKANIIPSSIEVYVKVALRDIEQVKESSVEVICDFSQLNEFPNRKKMQLLVSEPNGRFEISRTSQLSVDYLLFKQ